MSAMAPCPHCGEWIADDAVSCRHCGSDAETGWSPDVDYHSVEIPDALPADFDEVERPRGLGRRRGLVLAIAAAWLLAVLGVTASRLPQLLNAVLSVAFFLWLILVVFRRR